MPIPNSQGDPAKITAGEARFFALLGSLLLATAVSDEGKAVDVDEETERELLVTVKFLSDCRPLSFVERFLTLYPPVGASFTARRAADIEQVLARVLRHFEPDINVKFYLQVSKSVV